MEIEIRSAEGEVIQKQLVKRREFRRAKFQV
jgi:hypothetical protein